MYQALNGLGNIERRGAHSDCSQSVEDDGASQHDVVPPPRLGMEDDFQGLVKSAPNDLSTQHMQERTRQLHLALNKEGSHSARSSGSLESSEGEHIGSSCGECLEEFEDTDGAPSEELVMFAAIHWLPVGVAHLLVNADEPDDTGI